MLTEITRPKVQSNLTEKSKHNLSFENQNFFFILYQKFLWFSHQKQFSGIFTI